MIDIYVLCLFIKGCANVGLAGNIVQGCQKGEIFVRIDGIGGDRLAETCLLVNNIGNLLENTNTGGNLYTHEAIANGST